MYEDVRSDYNEVKIAVMMTARQWENILRNANEHFYNFIHCRTLKM